MTGSEETAAVSRAVLLRGTPWCELRNLDTFKRKPKLRDSRAALRHLQERPAGEWGGLDSAPLAPSGQSFEGKAWKLQGMCGGGWGRAKTISEALKLARFSSRETLMPSENCVNLSGSLPVKSDCAHPSAHHDIFPGLPCLCWGENRKRSQLAAELTSTSSWVTYFVK